MSTGDEEPKKADGPPPVFQGDAASGGGRTAVIAIALGLAGISAAQAYRASLHQRPPAPVASATPKPPPTPLAVTEGATVKVPGATFQMGSNDGDDDEKPITAVTVAPFELDLTEVTVAVYARCVAAGKCTAPDTGMYCNWKKPGNEAHPINCIDLKQAGDVCAFTGKRLPTEPEWELAARGTDGRRFPWKDGDPGAQLCWNGDGNDRGRGNRQGTCPVASYPAGASPFGALDMAGNVWEWTSSAYCSYDRRDCGADKRVIRGGGWNNLVPAYVRAQDRSKEAPGSRPDNLGVRCAKSPS
jgi:formylglycine-generating enzyme required for sulfatase activity